MNRIYRSIWSVHTNTFTAVSENTKSAGKQTLSGSGEGAFSPLFALKTLVASLMLIGTSAMAMPTGAVVTAGDVAISSGAGAMTITQGSQNAAINWNSFNIGQGEAVRFVQPNASSVALNRVLGSDASSILGNLSANGKVFLINPNGIMFGQGASVNVGGLVASTLDISDADFLAGNYRFNANGSNGKVLNKGNITASGGYIAMLGAQVSNEGVIQARLGTVALAAGNAMTLDVAGDGLLNVTVDQGAVGALVQNGSLIKADGGTVLMTAQAAGDLLKTVVNNTGVIEAHTLEGHAGTIKLLGDMKTGTVNVAGTLDASAPNGGNGGFIETSAATVNIDNNVKVTTAANQGLNGTWLIDPVGFNIDDTGGNMTGAALTASLKNGDIKIESTTGDISVNDNVSWFANKLTLSAKENININTAMRGSGTASLALEYGQSTASGTGTTYNVKAEIDLPSGNNFSTKQGSTGPVITYTVINDLGTAVGAAAGTLQGMGLTGKYVLGSNIDARGTAGWNNNAGFTPIGTNANQFNGTLDGLGHEIHGLTVKRTDDAHAAMFGNIGANGVVRNLTLTNATMVGGVTGGNYAGVAALAGINHGLIDNVRASVAITGAYYAYVGGLVGENHNLIQNSYTSGTVQGNSYAGSGGLVGINLASGVITKSGSSAVTGSNYSTGGLVNSNQGTISDSFATGNVNAPGSAQYGGGLASVNAGTIRNSYATGTVTGRNVGGLVGSAAAESLIENSYATGDVNGTQNVGGLVATSPGGTIQNSYATGNVTGTTGFIGGIAGHIASSTITNVYYSGTLAGSSSDIGGILGHQNGGSVINAYFNQTANPARNAVGSTYSNAYTRTNATGLSSADMLNPAKYIGFNFTSTAGATGNNWVIVNQDGSLNGAGGSDSTRPMLASEHTTTITSAHQLQLMAMDKTASYTLRNDINAASTATGKDVWGSRGFIPVGTGDQGSTSAHFNGVLDGAFNVITGLTIQRPSSNFTGLFGTLGSNGIVKNLGMEGGSIFGLEHTGAIAGMNMGNLSKVYSTVAIRGDFYAGGLAGSLHGGTVNNSYSSATINAEAHVGGLVGYNAGAIVNSYTDGAVNGQGFVGGLAGNGNNGQVTNSYWNTETTGQTGSDGGKGTGLTTAQMKNLNSYANWELKNTWVVYDGQAQAYLRGFMKQIAITVKTDEVTYDGQEHAGSAGTATYSNLTDSDLKGSLVYTGNGGAATNAGTYATAASGQYSTGGQRGYSIVYIDGGLKINKRALTLVGGAGVNRVYDGTNVAALSGTLDGIVAGDVGNVIFSGLGTFLDKNAGDNKLITASNILGGSAGSNYTLAPITGLSANITKATISAVDSVVINNKVYNGNDVATAAASGASFSGMIAGDKLTVGSATATFDGKNAGVGKTVTVSNIVLGGDDAGNYTLASTTSAGTGTITAKEITGISGITASNKVYDGTDTAMVDASAALFTGIIANDDLTIVSAEGKFNNKNAADGKTVTFQNVVFGGTDALNYTVTASSGSTTANITKATINAVDSVVINNKVYDGNDVATAASLGASFSGMIAGDKLTVGSATATFDGKNVGVDKTVTVSNIVLGGDDAGNYTLASATSAGTGTITAKEITGISGITASNKIYDGTDIAIVDASAASFTGIIANDDLTIVSAEGKFNDKRAADGKTVTFQNVVFGGTDALNYTVTASSGSTTANIAKATIASVGGITAANKVYDTTDAAIINTANASFAGIRLGDNLTVSTASAAFNNKHADTGKTVTIGGITLGGTDAGNYTLTSNTATTTANITKATITSVGGIVAANKVYDATDAATINTAGASFTGLLNDDNLTVATANSTFNDKTANTGKTVTIDGITLGGTDAGNYTLASNTATTTANISKATIASVGGITAVNKDYDGTDVASLNKAGASFNGVLGSDNLTVAAANGTFNDKNANMGKTVTIDGITLGGTDADNYTLATTTAATTANVNQKALTISADNVSKESGQANPLFTANYNGLVNGETSASLAGNLVLTTTAVDSSPAGTYQIVASGQTSDNYAINYVAGTLTVNAEPGSGASTNPVVQNAVAVATGSINTVAANGDVKSQATEMNTIGTGGNAISTGANINLGEAPMVTDNPNSTVRMIAGLNLAVQDFGIQVPVEFDPKNLNSEDKPVVGAIGSDSQTSNTK